MSVLLPVALVAAMNIGCARTAEERQLESMRADIDRLQEERDRADRPALPADVASAQAAAPEPASSAEPAATSEGVRVGAEDPLADDYADPEDTTPRPKIRVLGPARGRAAGIADEQVDAPPDDTTSAARPSLDPDAKRAYDAALSLVGSRKYDPAIDALAAFLVKWPDHPYADHALYWRGECYYARGDYGRAAEQFEGVVARFPAGAKAADALLKLGLCHQKLGHGPQAKESFDRLIRDYPRSDAARRVPTAPAMPRAAPSPPGSPTPEDPR